MSQTQNTQNLSQAYKGYKARKKAEGGEILDFPTWKRMYGLRKPRTRKSQPTQAPTQATNGHVNPNAELIAQAQALIAQLSQQATQPTQGHAQAVEIRNPDEQATGRQLWKLMDLGLIPFISKGDASEMIEQALAAK